MKQLRVVIVTGTRAHHKRLCAEIARAFNLVGIIHPRERPGGPVAQVRKLSKRASSYGWSMVFMALFGRIASGIRGCCSQTERDSGMTQELRELEALYYRLPQSIVYPSFDVRGVDCQSRLRALRPDIGLCLGGPVYPKSFINAFPLVLNYHSGISPIYNGAASIQFAFANGHPHLCGGTLMMMGKEVDGGRILGHFLPEVRPGDSPATLFQKTVAGASKMYLRLLEYLAESCGQLHGIPQPRPLFYTTGFQLGWYQQTAIARNLDVDVAAAFQRGEAIIEYWREKDEASAHRAYSDTLNMLLWASSPTKAA